MGVTMIVFSHNSKPTYNSCSYYILLEYDDVAMKVTSYPSLKILFLYYPV